MTFAIYLITSVALLSTILPYLGDKSICFIILFILLSIWLLCYEKIHEFIKKE